MPRGSRPGERRGGRQAGTPNKVTATLQEYADQYTNEAVDALVKIGRDVEVPPAARVAAWREVLDRGNGKAPQAVTGVDGAGKANGPIQIIYKLRADTGNRA